MELMVKDLLGAKELDGARLLGGEKGLNRTIKGVTIIEAPDIVRFISGGEVLLTGLYAFRSCTTEEFQKYTEGLADKSVTAIIIKRGRVVENADEKIDFLTEFSNNRQIPLLEVPFEVSFRDIISFIMERLFNQEMTRLKFFKTTHDNFAAIALSCNSTETAIENILDVLEKLIRNPIALFNRHLSCIAATEGAGRELCAVEECAAFEPGIYTDYTYFKQEGRCPRCVIRVNIGFREDVYLAVTEKNQPFTTMDCIAAESAVGIIKFELARQHAVEDLENKFQNDIMHNILNGKAYSAQELKKNTSLLGLSLHASCKVIIFELCEGNGRKDDLQARLEAVNLLREGIIRHAGGRKVYNNFDKIAVIWEAESQNHGDDRRDIEGLALKAQAYVDRYDKKLRIKGGAGNTAQGISRLSRSCKEANEALKYADIAKEITGMKDTLVTFFSDLGIFKLLCRSGDVSGMLEYVPEGLKRLCQYKINQREELLVTLKTYLDKNQNLSKTAQALYIHYKTASYRIEKIGKITGIDFASSNEVLAYRIGLVVYRMLETYNQDQDS